MNNCLTTSKFGGPGLPTIPKTFCFSFSKTELTKILAGIPNEKVLVAAKSQLTRLEGTCNSRVPGGSSGCSRSNAVALEESTVCLTHCAFRITKTVLEPFVFTLMWNKGAFFLSLCRSAIGWGAWDENHTKAAVTALWHAGTSGAAALSLSRGSAARLQ